MSFENVKVIQLDMHKEALELAGKGFSVLPIKTRQKAPVLFKEWQKKPTLTLAQVSDCWSMNPTANIAIRLDNLAVLDIDPRRGGSLDDLVNKFGKFPDTVESISGRGDRGKHLYFTLPDDVLLPHTNFEIVQGVDVKAGCGAYVLAPPSIHPDTQRCYIWEGVDTPEYNEIAIAPSWLLDAVRKENTHASNVVLHDEDILLSEGRRNSFYVSLAGSMRARGIGTEIILSTLRETNAKQTLVPSEDAELVAIADWSSGKGVHAHYADMSEDAAAKALDPQGVGEWIADLMATEYTYEITSKKWYRNVGTHWALWNDSAELKTVWSKAALIQTFLGKARAAHVRRVMNDKFMRDTVLTRVRGRLLFSYDDFLKSPWLLNVGNGVLDLCERSFRLRTAHDMFLGFAPVTYDPQAACPQWEAFLGNALNGNKETLRYLQQLCGLVLTGELHAKAAMFVYGEKHTGKTTFLQTLHNLLGEGYYSATTDIDTFKEGSKGNAHNSAKALLAGRRFVYIDETSRKEKIDTSRFKRVTSGYGAMETGARRLYCDSFDYPIEYMLTIGTNELPRLETNDKALWDRVCPVLFLNSIPIAKQDGDLRAKLDSELSGILNWCLQGLYDFLDNGKKLAMPSEIEALKEKLRLEFNPVASFVEACCTRGKDLTTPVDGLQNAFQLWCDEKLIDLSKAGKYYLGKELKREYGIESKNKNNTRVYVGILYKGEDSSDTVQME